METQMAQGLVSDVIRFSSVDGPGNRFVAFLQGCNFDCIACHNPYTINPCNDCGDCIVHCPSGALSLVDSAVRWDDAVCSGSGQCIASCPHDSTPKARWTSVADLVDQVRGPAPFLSGVTVSGGEATQQPQFVRDWFTALRDDPRLGRLTRFVDSNGAAEASVWDELDPVMDAAMIDLKAFDDDVHRSMTGMSNEPVLETIRLLAGRGKLHEVRLLMVPGVNDDQAMVRRTAAWLHDVDPAMRVKVIGFRCHGVRPTNRELREPSVYRMAGYAELLRSEGIEQLTFV